MPTRYALRTRVEKFRKSDLQANMLQSMYIEKGEKEHTSKKLQALTWSALAAIIVSGLAGIDVDIDHIGSPLGLSLSLHPW